MPLQTQRLGMAGLGVRGDVPPNIQQPPLPDGVHLRWALPRSFGFPWYGFYLFRREHRRTEALCTSSGTVRLKPGAWMSSTLSTPFGDFTSDRNLLFTEDFAPKPGVELDLRGRSYLLFTLKQALISRAVTVELGFRGTGNGPARIRVLAKSGEVSVAQAELAGQPGNVVRARLEADAISAVEIPGGAAVLIDICFEPVSQDATTGWQAIEELPYPLALPVRHPDYPANPLPPDIVSSEATALGRITYGLPGPWTASFKDLHAALQSLVTGGPGGTPMADKLMPGMSGVPPAPDGPVPHLADTRTLDLVLLATLNRAMADMIGLAFVDKSAAPGARYDYLIVASHTGAGYGSAGAMLKEIGTNQFANVDGFIVFNKAAQASPALPAPTGTRAYALPGTTLTTQTTGVIDATNNAGLRWSLPTAGGILAPGQPVTYHVWRAECGNGAAPVESPFDMLTKVPVLVVEPVLPPGLAPQRAADWPPFALHYIDIGPAEGWYAYRPSGVDIFGRHSAQGERGAWFQWAPEPVPSPWYYSQPPAGRLVHADAVRLLDKSPPPPPTAIEAFALDPADPTVLKDSAYQAWLGALSPAERVSIIGLRVRWQWTDELARQAPDAAEFRIYYQPGRPNALLGDITAVAAASPTESLVTTNISNTAASDALTGAALRAGALTFPIVGSNSGSPLTIRVANLGLTVVAGTVTVTHGSAIVTGAGTAWHAGMTGLHLNVTGMPQTYTILGVDSPTALRLTTLYSGASAAGQAYTVHDVRPPASGPVTVTIPERYAKGSIAVTNGSNLVTGTGTQWTATLVGMPFTMEGDAGRYRVSAVHSPTELLLDLAYGGMNRSGLAYTIVFPLFTDYRTPANWDERVYVVDFHQHVQVTVDGAGRPLRKYEVLIPAVGDAVRGGVPLVTSLAEPVAYAQVSVSTADSRPHSPDAAKWTPGHFGNRAGNEGNVGSMATIFRVRREPPPAPVPPPDAERVFATPADYHSESFYTYRWVPITHLRTHVFRAVDDAVFQEDWRHRPRPALDPADTSQFPAAEPRWTLLKRQQVAAELDALNAHPHTDAGKAAAMAAYRALSNDGLRVLAGLPGNDRAFTQITTYALEPDDAATSDRRGPDSPAGYVPSAGLRAYVDTLDGRSTSRYFYRSAYVDGANNTSGLSLSSPPVWLPNVVPPRAPVLTRILGGERAITVSWASNREADLAKYRLYRADAVEAARDLRLMTLVHEALVTAGDPEARPAQLSFVDAPVPGLVTFHYRLVAVDSAGNVSVPSEAASGRGFDESLPVAPAPAVEWVTAGSARRAQIAWSSPDETMLQRRDPGRSWVELASWRPPGAYSLRDPFSDPTHSYEYRIWSRKATGAVSKGAGVTLAHE